MLSDLKQSFDQRYVAAALIFLLVIATGSVVQFLEDSQTGFSADAPERQALHDASAGANPEHDYARDAVDGSATETTERKRATRYDIDLEVPDVEQAMDETEAAVRESKGYVKSSSFNRRDGASGSLEVTVPENDATEFLDLLDERWDVGSQRKNVDDVTDRYTELELELKNKRQELERLEDLMNQSDDVESLIKVQERMSEVRSRIQYLENQLEDLDQRVEYTTIHIDFKEPQPITHEFEVREALRSAYQGIFRSLNLIIVGTGYLLPFLIIGVILYRGRKFVSGARKEE